MTFVVYVPIIQAQSPLIIKNKKNKKPSFSFVN